VEAAAVAAMALAAALEQRHLIQLIPGLATQFLSGIIIIVLYLKLKAESVLAFVHIPSPLARLVRRARTGQSLIVCKQ
jgi:hypothetical protein